MKLFCWTFLIFRFLFLFSPHLTSTSISILNAHTLLFHSPVVIHHWPPQGDCMAWNEIFKHIMSSIPGIQEQGRPWGSPTNKERKYEGREKENNASEKWYSWIVACFWHHSHHEIMIMSTDHHHNPRIYTHVHSHTLQHFILILIILLLNIPHIHSHDFLFIYSILPLHLLVGVFSTIIYSSPMNFHLIHLIIIQYIVCSLGG